MTGDDEFEKKFSETLNDTRINPRLNRRKFLQVSGVFAAMAALPEQILTPKRRELEAGGFEILDLSDMTQEEINTYVDKELNPQLEADIKAHPEKMRPGMSYYSIEITKTDYLNFKNRIGRTFDEQLTIQNRELNRVLIEANNRLAEEGMSRNIEGCYCRRIVLLPPQMLTPALADDDGYYRVNENYDIHSYYFDPATNCDWGFNHEVGHEIGLPDLYSLDFLWSGSNAQSANRERLLEDLRKGDKIGYGQYVPIPDNLLERVIPPDLEQIPNNWKEYEGIPGLTMPDLMQDCNNEMGMWTSFFKSKSISEGWSHNWTKQNGLAAWSFPNEVGKDIAPENFLKVGNKFSGKKIEVYQSTAPTHEKGLKKISEGQVESNGTYAIGNPFVRPEVIPDGEWYVREGMPAFGSVLLVVIRDNNDQITNWQYIDITAFNMAAWKGFNNRAVVGFNMADAQSANPRDFDWGLTFGGTKMHEVFLPHVSN